MEIQEIKSHLTLTQVLAHYGLQPDKHGKLHCPFHADKTPSLQLYLQTHTWTCFSSNCQAGSGDVIDFIMKMEKGTKHEAIKKATQLTTLGPPVPSATPSGAAAFIHPSPATTLSRSAVLTKFYQTCTQGIARSEKARAYAEKRMLKHGQLGLGYMGPDFYKSWNETLKASAATIGLLKKTPGGYSHTFRHCLVFTMKDRQGHIIDLYARSLNDAGNTRHFYLPGPHQGLYPGYPKAETTKLILTEGIIDAATLLQHPTVSAQYALLACYGTNGFTAEHGQAIHGLEQLEEVIIFFDGDGAGKKGTLQLAEKLRTIKGKFTITEVNTPEGEDINSLAQSYAGDPAPGGKPDIFIHLLAHRTSLSSRPPVQPGPPSFSTGRYGDEKKETSNTTPTPVPGQGKLHTDNPELLFYENGVLNITVLGGIRITGMDKMRVTLKLETKTKEYALPLRHTLDLYNKVQVDQLCCQAVEALEVTTREAVHALCGLTSALEQYRESRLALLKPKKEEPRKLTDPEKRETLDYLASVDLLKHTSQDITKSGIVGEKINSMIAWFTFTSRKRDKPLHLMCMGASGTGKTYLQEKISQLIPEEDRLEITTLSENAFYYFGQEELKHKLILIEDLDGAENVLYPLRELQSKTSISKTVTLKDNKGNLKTVTLKVEGPVSVSSCTTREKIYEDNANRCILVYIDTTSEQDKRILDYQQQLSAGTVDQRAENQVKEKLKNVQRLLRPIKIRNPYAQHINLPESVFKPRRTMLLLLSFIETITFYHQYQRGVKQDKDTGELYIESTVSDVEYAFRLLKEVLFSKSDELSGACRKFFEQLKGYLQKEKKENFYASQVRKSLRLNPNNLKRYLVELSRHSYIRITAGSKYKGYEYQVADFNEYDELKSSIDRKLEEILLTIRSGPAYKKV